jgi:F-type H+-transporting ATPase subunit b
MDFDWTSFAFQLVNVFILLAILRRFLFRPVAAIIAERQAETDRALERAETTRREADAAADAAREEREALAARRAHLIAKAEAEAGAVRQDALKKARAEAAALIEDAQTEARTIRVEGEAAALDRARTLALSIAEKLLAETPADARVAGYARRLADTLAALPEQERTRLLAGEMRLIAPRALTDSEAEEARASLAPFGLDGIAAGVDPSLIAGLELRGPSGVVRNSLAHDLDRIARALISDDREAA